MPRQKEDSLLNEVIISAPVRIPDKDNLAIELVPVDLVYRLEEYRSDETRWEAVLWTLIGAIIGIVVNWATDEPLLISKTSIVLIMVISIMALLSGLAVRDFRKRADEVKSRMLFLNTKKKVEASKPDSVNVTVSDFLTGKTVTAELPSNVPIHRVLPALVTKLQLPTNIQYELLHRDSGKLLERKDTLNTLNVEDSDTLWLIPPVASVASSDVQAKPETEATDDPKVTVTVFDQAGGKSVTAQMPANVPLYRILPVLVERMQLPTNVEYEVQHKQSGKTLSGASSLSESEVKTGDTLRLLPRIPPAPIVTG